MPLFEYRCLNCRKKYILLIGVAAEREKQACPHCGSSKAKKLISLVRRMRSEEETIEKLADPSAMGDLNDPNALRRWAKKLGKEMGEEMGDEFDQMLDEEMEKENRKTQSEEERADAPVGEDDADEALETL